MRVFVACRSGRLHDRSLRSCSYRDSIHVTSCCCYIPASAVVLPLQLLVLPLPLLLKLLFLLLLLT